MPRPTEPEQTKPSPASDPTLVRIREGLALLRLGHAAERLEELVAEPAADLSRLEWLWALLEPQLRAGVESRIERRIRQSRLPERKTLESFRFEFQPSLDKDQVLDLATLGFLKDGKNVLLAGMSGTGKSHIGMALALNACTQNLSVRYTTNAKMLSALNASLAVGNLQEVLKQYTRPDLLMIDEVGLEQVERTVASRAGLMQKVLLPRYDEPRRSTIITSNIPWESWGDYLGDHLGAAALIDRLLHRSCVIVINGPSWRDHEHTLEVGRNRTKSSSAAVKPVKVVSAEPATPPTKPAKPSTKPAKPSAKPGKPSTKPAKPSAKPPGKRAVAKSVKPAAKKRGK